MTEVELWVLVDENGEYEVPTPAAVELEAEIAGEPSDAELKVA